MLAVFKADRHMVVVCDAVAGSIVATAQLAGHDAGIGDRGRR